MNDLSGTSRTVNLVRKLLALAKEGSGASEAEAASALEKARAMMADANLTMATLEGMGQSGGAGSARVNAWMSSTSPYPWKRRIVLAVAKLNSVFCEEQREGRVFIGYTMIGREANVASTRVMAEYLVEAVTRVQRESVGNDPARTKDRGSFLFREGCSTRIVERLQARHDEEVYTQSRAAAEQKSRQGSQATGSSLVVIMEDYYQAERDLNDDLRYGMEPGSTARMRAEEKARRAAYQAEVEARRAAALADGMSPEVADWVAYGYSRGRAEEILRRRAEEDKKDKKGETPSQKRRREEREERSWRSYQERSWRRNSKFRTAEYRLGYAAGNDVGLDRQADYRAKRGLAQTKDGRGS